MGKAGRMGERNGLRGGGMTNGMQAVKTLCDAITGSDGTVTSAPLGGDAVRQAWADARPGYSADPDPQAKAWDVIDRPEHYASLSPEPLDVIEAWGLGFHEGNVLKYLARWRRKGGVQDLRKAAEYLRRLILVAEQSAE